MYYLLNVDTKCKAAHINRRECLGF